MLAALWLEVRRRASYIVAGVICPDIIGTQKVGNGRTWPSKAKKTPGGSVGYGERAAVSSYVIFVVNSVRVVIRRPVEVSVSERVCVCVCNYVCVCVCVCLCVRV